MDMGADDRDGPCLSIWNTSSSCRSSKQQRKEYGQYTRRPTTTPTTKGATTATTATRRPRQEKDAAAAAAARCPKAPSTAGERVCVCEREETAPPGCGGVIATRTKQLPVFVVLCNRRKERKETKSEEGKGDSSDKHLILP